MSAKMSNENYYSIVNNDSYIFCLGQNNLSAYDIQTDKELFSIQSTEFPHNTSLNTLLLLDNTLYIGSNDGVYFLETDYLKKMKIMAPTAYVVLNSKVQSEQKIAHYRYKSDAEYELSLNIVNLLLEKYKVAYEIKKDGEVWINKRPTNNLDNTVNFKGLEPAEYEIIYTIESNWQGWNKSFSYKFIVNKNWWQETWMHIILILVALVSILLITNVTLRRYKNNIDKQTALEQRLFELESVSILAQLKPHFIFNALVPIQSFLYTNNKAKGLAYLDKFSQLVRSLLEGIRSKNIILDKEINFLQNYLYLQKERFSDSFNYEITYSEHVNIYVLEIPNMILQPIIENAVEHGIDHNKDDGAIKISFDVVDNELVIIISDNGIGFDTENLFKPNHAITIIKEHIDLLRKITGYGSLTYVSTINKGTSFTIRLPIIEIKST